MSWRGSRAQSQNRGVVAQSRVVDEPVGNDPVDDRVHGGVGGRADQNARLHELLLHLDARLVQSVDRGEEIVLAGEENVIHESAQRLVVEVELLVLQHVQQRQQRPCLSRPRRTLHEREVGHRMRSPRQSHRSVQRGLHRKQLAAVELLAQVSDEGGGTARPGLLVGQWRRRRVAGEELGIWIVHHIVENGGILTRVDAAVEARSRGDHFEKQRVDGEAEGGEFGGINGGEKIVVHAATDEAFAGVSSRLGEETLQEAVGAWGGVSAERFGGDDFFLGLRSLPAERAGIVVSVDTVVEEEQRGPLADGGAELRQRVDGTDAGDEGR